MPTLDLPTILQHMADGFLAVDAGWRVTAANAAAESLFQRPIAALVGASLEDAVPDLAGSRAANDLQQAAAGSLARRIEHFSPSRYTWYEFRAVPRDGELYLFARNVTDRARLQQSEAVRAAVRTLLVDAPVAILTTRGAEHRYELVNERARQLVGGRQLEGQTMRNAFPELVDSPLMDVIDEVFRTGVPYTGRNVAVRYDRDGDGAMYDGVFDFTYQPLFEADGRVSGILTVAVEVTEYADERARLEAARSLEEPQAPA